MLRPALVIGVGLPGTAVQRGMLLPAHVIGVKLSGTAVHHEIIQSPVHGMGLAGGLVHQMGKLLYGPVHGMRLLVTDALLEAGAGLHHSGMLPPAHVNVMGLPGTAMHHKGIPPEHGVGVHGAAQESIQVQRYTYEDGVVFLVGNSLSEGS